MFNVGDFFSQKYQINSENFKDEFWSSDPGSDSEPFLSRVIRIWVFWKSDPDQGIFVCMLDKNPTQI